MPPNVSVAPQAITFDFWDTLIVARAGRMRDRRTDALLGLIEGAGFAAQRQAVEASIGSAFGEFRRAWHANEQYGAPQAVDHILDELGVDVPRDVRDELAEAIRAGDPDPELAPNVAGTLRALKDAGVRLGIICDVGWSPSTLLRGHLERHGVLQHFDHWSFSDDVGHYKPAPEIFHHAHEGLGVEDPATAAHVGDLRRTDVAGALAYGIVAVRYSGVFDDQSDDVEADHVVADHAELPGVLGLA